MANDPVLKKIDAVVVKVPNLEVGLAFYTKLGLSLKWRTASAAGLGLGESELVLSSRLDPETDILVESVPKACTQIINAGGHVVVEPKSIDIGLVAVVNDPFGNKLTLVDLSNGLYQTDRSGNVTGVK